MELNDLDPVNPKPKNLEEMSIAALGEYIEELEAEIARAKTMIKSKEIARNGAESVFNLQFSNSYFYDFGATCGETLTIPMDQELIL